jgi:hypothetical protein
MTNQAQRTRSTRLLVCIASYGQKNMAFLRQIVQRYQGMAMKVEILVCSEGPKDLGPGVKVIVGLPTRNPWSLPFAHKALLAENVERHDLFVYSEDDVEAGEDHIHNFLRASGAMEADEIPGFVRYELTPGGTKVLTDVHGAFSWKPDSVARRGPYTTAEFSNEHAGFYVLTQAHLRRAIASGRFLTAPHEGRYGLPETAATDVYSACGLRKVICISHFQDFLVRHMTNLYVNRHGVPLERFNEQIQVLKDIGDRIQPASRLCEVESRMSHMKWSKEYYEPADRNLLEMVPDDAKRVLSIGCGFGETELKLKQRGASVTVLPLDSVVGGIAALRGFEVINGTMSEGLEGLRGRRFDCVLVSNLIHLQRQPEWLVRRWAGLVGKAGSLVIRGPNFDRSSDFVKRLLGIGEHSKLRSFEDSGITLCNPKTLARQIGKAGLEVTTVRWLNHELPGKRWAKVRIGLGALTARDWILSARCQ